MYGENGSSAEQSSTSIADQDLPASQQPARKKIKMQMVVYLIVIVFIMFKSSRIVPQQQKSYSI